MNFKSHILGFPRIGINRELKFAQEKFWLGTITKEELFSVGSLIRKENWERQYHKGLDFVTVGDFSWYDHVLQTSMFLGNIPKRHLLSDEVIDINTLFRVARGYTSSGNCISASEMTKWFNTNYHYIVPEFYKKQNFKFSWDQVLNETDEALSLGYNVKPVILGPLTYLWLGKINGENFDKLDLLKKILPIYKHLLNEFKKRNISWIQIDEPILSLVLPSNWKNSFLYVYEELNGIIKILLTTYFDEINHNLDIIQRIPIQGLHLDLIYGNYDLPLLNKILPENISLSLGIINGKNIWRSDLFSWFKKINLISKHNERNFLIGSSCSFLHIPIDITVENSLDLKFKKLFSFSVQKCEELKLITNALNTGDFSYIEEYSKIINNFFDFNKNNKNNIQDRINKIDNSYFKRKNVYEIRKRKQIENFKLPILPTTTIGSFPQIDEIRQLRMNYKNGNITNNKYEKEIFKHIKSTIKLQENLDLDVLVHGEPERNDMVEYFSQYMNGFVFTNNGWVQSYGSRCVKPPIIVGDISRKKTITVKWSKFAQSLTNRPVKGMLTGPITILSWSFPREDISKKNIAQQIALTLRNEVLDLESSGIKIIQIDEPALKEGLPINIKKQKKYLSWAIKSFKLMSCGVQDTTQIHTHMCYCEFSDIMDTISNLDADVITIETSRSNMDLLDSFKKFKYPNDIGPGVYDIHTTNIPTVKNIKCLIKKAMKYISVEKLWINPDCGLKTRTINETILGLKNMIKAAKKVRNTL